jgi:LPXTG-motif cell wall-anchored protein
MPGPVEMLIIGVIVGVPAVIGLAIFFAIRKKSSNMLPKND